MKLPLLCFFVLCTVFAYATGKTTMTAQKGLVSYYNAFSDKWETGEVVPFGKPLVILMEGDSIVLTDKNRSVFRTQKKGSEINNERQTSLSWDAKDKQGLPCVITLTDDKTTKIRMMMIMYSGKVVYNYVLD